MGIRERSAERRKRIVGHIAKDFEDAEDRDIEYWQSKTPQQRLSALVAIQREIKATYGSFEAFEAIRAEEAEKRRGEMEDNDT